MKNFTFKKVPKYKYKWTVYNTTIIKLNKKEIGYIRENNSCWKISIAIKKEKTKQDPCDFKWITLKYKAKDENQAREFLKVNCKNIQNKYELHQFDNCL